MLNCESCHHLMADALYEKPDQARQAQLEEHLQACPDCRAIHQELLAANAELRQAGLASGGFDDIPERASMTDIWQRIEPALDRIDAERYHQLSRRSLAPWAAAITAVAASVIVFFSVLTPTGPGNGPTPQIVSTENVSPELMNYLNRAQVMLMQVANTESSNVSEIPVTQTFARNMAFEASLLNTDNDRSFRSGERKLLKDIEFLLLQIANLDAGNMEAGVGLLQRYLEENSILFRIRLLEMREQDQDLVI